MGTYSSHDDLINLVDAVIQNNWSIGGIRYGSGIDWSARYKYNDMGVVSPDELGQTELESYTDVTVRIIGGALSYVERVEDGYDYWALREQPDFFSVDFSGIGGGSGGAILPALRNYIGNGITVTWGTQQGHRIGSWWQFRATPIVRTGYREIAYDWLNAALERTHDVPFSSPTRTVILAEATYAIYLILRYRDDPRYAEFYAEAYNLLKLLTDFRTPAETPTPGEIPTPTGRK